MRYRGNKICPDERTDERGGRTVRKHNAFDDNVGWREGIKIKSTSVFFIVRPKCTLAVSRAAPWWVTVSMPTGQTDRRIDARALHYAFRYGRGQPRKPSTTYTWLMSVSNMRLLDPCHTCDFVAQLYRATSCSTQMCMSHTATLPHKQELTNQLGQCLSMRQSCSVR